MLLRGNREMPSFLLQITLVLATCGGARTSYAQMPFAGLSPFNRCRFSLKFLRVMSLSPNGPIMTTFWRDASPSFVVNPREPLRKEFDRLAAQKGWKRGGRRYKKEWSKCIGEEFTANFGSNEERLEGWRALCIEVGIKDIQTSVTQYKKVLNGVFVNLVDLLDCRRTGGKVKRYKTAEALRSYTRSTGKYLPKTVAKKNGFLEVLIHMS